MILFFAIVKWVKFHTKFKSAVVNLHKLYYWKFIGKIINQYKELQWYLIQKCKKTIVIITGDDIFVLKDTFKTCRKKTLRKSKS